MYLVRYYNEDDSAECVGNGPRESERIEYLAGHAVDSEASEKDRRVLEQGVQIRFLEHAGDANIPHEQVLGAVHEKSGSR